MGQAGVIDEAFFRRYRELLDAEDSAFDELEHAYEDGDRAHGSAEAAEGSPPAYGRGEIDLFVRPVRCADDGHINTEYVAQPRTEHRRLLLPAPRAGGAEPLPPTLLRRQSVRPRYAGRE